MGEEDTEAAAGRFTAACLFSGMGGFASGLVEAGFRLVWAIDSDEQACTVFRHRFTDVRLIERDIRALGVAADQLSPVDVLAGGFPCQSFSQAGARHGFDDPRGETFFEITRLVREFAPNRRPRLLLLENVPHLLYGDRGQWFDRIQHALRNAGYWFRRTSCWVVNVKDATTLPQDRERLFLVAASRAHFNYNPFPPPRNPRQDGHLAHAGRQPRLDEFIDRSRRRAGTEYLPPENRYYKMIARKMAAGSLDNIYQLRRSYVREKPGGLCPTLTANMGRGGHNVPFVRDEWGIRRLGVDEVARLQGFAEPETILFPDLPVPAKYRLLGNAVCVHLAALAGRACRDALETR